MLGFIALILVVALVGGCAIAFGENSRASVSTHEEFKREVAKDSATVEDVLIQKEKKP